MRKELDKRLNLFVPQWQDSGETSELYAGAMALRKYLQNRLTFIDLVVDAGTELALEKNILGYSVVKKQLQLIKSRLEREAPGRIFTLGGGCGIELPVVAYLSRKYSDMDIFWFDAHGDLNCPESSPSKHFHGMPLRFLLESQGDNDISRMCPGEPARKPTLLGVRDLDPSEEDFIRAHNLPNYSSRDLQADPAGVMRDSLAGNNRYAYVHIDLDVLDPAEYPNVKCPSREGLSLENLNVFLDKIFSGRQVVGMSILENTGTDGEIIKKLEPLLRRIPDF